MQQSKKRSRDGKLVLIQEAYKKTGHFLTSFHLIRMKSRDDMMKYGKLFLIDAQVKTSYEKFLFPKDISHLNQLLALPEIPFNREILWQAMVIKTFQNQVSSFLKLKSEFDQVRLMSIGESKRILSEVNQQFGFSLWQLVNEFSIVAEEKGDAAGLAYLDKIIQDSSVSPILLENLRILRLQADKTVVREVFEKRVFDRTHNNKSNEYLYFKFCLFGNLSLKSLDNAFYLSNSDTLIDMYLTFINTCRVVVSNPFYSKYKASVVDAIKVLNSDFKDPILDNLRIILNLESGFDHQAKKSTLLPATNMYAQGNFEEVIVEILKCFSAKSINGEQVALLATAISRISSKKIPDSTKLLKDILDSLVQIATFGEAFVDSLVNIRRICSLHQNAEWSPLLIMAAELNRQALSWHHRIVTRNYCELSYSQDNPRFSLSLPTENSKRDFLKTFDVFGAQRGVRLYNILCDDHEFESDFSVIEKNYLARKFLARGEVEAAIKIYRDNLQLEIDEVSRLESSRYVAELFAHQGQFDDAANILAETYLKNNNTYGILNFKVLINSFIDADMPDLTAFGSVNMVICCEVFSRQSGEDLDSTILILIYRIMEHFKMSRPREIFKLKDACGDLRVDYLGRFIFLQRVIDSLDLFETQREIEEERIAICVELSAVLPNLKKEMENEITAIHKQLYVEGLIKDVEKRKIYVNTGQIKKNLEGKFLFPFKVYQVLLREKSQSLPQDKLMNDILSRKIELPPDLRRPIFLEIVNGIKEDFVFSNDCGLKHYLSVRIRHGSLSTEIRSQFEVKRLVSKLTNSQYDDNIYWRDKLAGEVSSKVNKLLKEFSRKIDHEINYLNDKIVQIKSESNTYGLFAYELKSEDLNNIEKSIGFETNFNDIVDIVLGILWGITADNLIQIRDYLQNEFFEKLDQSLLALHKEIDSIERFETSDTEVLRDLLNDINSTRGLVRHTIVRIATWFNISQEMDSQDFEFEDVFKVAEGILRKIYPNKSFELKCSGDTGRKYKASAFDGFVDIAKILIENCLIHGGDHLVNIEIHLNRSRPQKSLLRVVNSTFNKNRDDTNKIVSGIKKDIEGKKYLMDVNLEGKSGLKKLFKIFEMDLNCKPKLDAKLGSDEKFFVEINFNGESLEL